MRLRTIGRTKRSELRVRSSQFREKISAHIGRVRLSTEPRRKDSVGPDEAKPGTRGRLCSQKCEPWVAVGTTDKVKLSRVILGGNPIGGVAHSRDLTYVSELIHNDFTDEKIMETWEIAA